LRTILLRIGLFYGGAPGSGMFFLDISGRAMIGDNYNKKTRFRNDQDDDRKNKYESLLVVADL